MAETQTAVQAPAEKAATEANLLILSPREYQVFQRRTREEGPTFISGRMQVSADRLQARILGTPLEGKLESSWRDVPCVSEARSFSLALTLPAGGWYRLEVRALQGKKTVAEAAVEHFGIGEVFVGAGQSNSTNCGQFPTSQTSGMVSSFGGDSWKLANDPQLGVADHSTGGSFWPAFGDALYARYKVPIGVATTGFGGTSVNQWQPDTDLFRWFMTRVYQLGPDGFRAVLWHQGETDVEMTSDEYYEKLKRVILASKSHAGWEFPWFVAQVSYHNPQHPSFATTRTAQKRIWNDAIALEGPDTDTLTGDNRDLGGLGIHFSPKGLKAHGQMWAEKVIPYIDKALAAQEAK